MPADIIVGIIVLLAITVGFEARLASERRQLAVERDAWAAAAASERATLLRAAADERSALLAGVTQQQIVTASPWITDGPQRLYRTEADEIEGTTPTENIDGELERRGLADIST